MAVAQLFKPPTYSERPQTGNRLIDTRLKITRGVSVLKNQDGSYSQVYYPTQDQIAAAKVAYLGGHEYIVTDTEGTALTAAGYTVTPYVAPVTSSSASANPANINGPQGPGALTRTFG